ncbi:MAG: hypothetical protein RR436_06135 [Clostridia bacterium]
MNSLKCNCCNSPEIFNELSSTIEMLYYIIKYLLCCENTNCCNKTCKCNVDGGYF